MLFTPITFQESLALDKLEAFTQELTEASAPSDLLFSLIDNISEYGLSASLIDYLRNDEQCKAAISTECITALEKQLANPRSVSTEGTWRVIEAAIDAIIKFFKYIVHSIKTYLHNVNQTAAGNVAKLTKWRKKMGQSSVIFTPPPAGATFQTLEYVLVDQIANHTLPSELPFDTFKAMGVINTGLKHKFTNPVDITTSDNLIELKKAIVDSYKLPMNAEFPDLAKVNKVVDLKVAGMYSERKAPKAVTVVALGLTNLEQCQNAVTVFLDTVNYMRQQFLDFSRINWDSSACIKDCKRRIEHEYQDRGFNQTDGLSQRESQLDELAKRAAADKALTNIVFLSMGAYAKMISSRIVVAEQVFSTCIH